MLIIILSYYLIVIVDVCGIFVFVGIDVIYIYNDYKLVINF